MAEKHIHSTISVKGVTYPRETPSRFTVTATNRSNKFASFQLRLEARDFGQISDDWYKISPIVSSKNPPGDSTKFEIEITGIPRKPGKTVGSKIVCYAIVSSIELLPEIDRTRFDIIIKNDELIPLQVSKSRQDFYRKLNPAQEKTWEIGIEIYNPRSKKANVLVQLEGLDSNWLKKQPSEQKKTIEVGMLEQVIFYCQPDKNAECRTYNFTIKVIDSAQDAIPIILKGQLEILLTGELIQTLIGNNQEAKTFANSLHNLEQRLIQTLYVILLWKKHNEKTYKFQLENQSNLPRQVAIKIAQSELDKFKEIVTVTEFKTRVLTPGETTQESLTIQAKKAPWFWFLGEKILELNFNAYWSDLQDDNKVTKNLDPIKFPVKSIFPIWYLVLFLSVLSSLFWWFSCLNPFSNSCGHHKRVNTVQFDGLGARLVSVSNDMKIIEWDTVGFFNPTTHQEIQETPTSENTEEIDEGDNNNQQKKQNLAKMVIRYRPINNNIVAAGLENGQIQLWDLTRKAEKPIACFQNKKANRVLALEFSQDSRYLYSGHGNGRVVKWKVDYNQKNWSRNQDSDAKCSQQALEQEKQFNFSVYALKFVEQDNRSKLAIAGRFNKLLIWDSFEEGKVQQIPYPSGGRNQYIQSLDTAEFRPGILASADNRGRTFIWDLNQCSSRKDCRHVDQWYAHSERPVRSVALSADGCYLVTGGDDARVMLWALTPEGKRAWEKGKPTQTLLKKILKIISKQRASDNFNTLKVNSVDIKMDKQWRFFSWNERGFFKTEEKILIASGWDENPQVQVESLWKKDKDIENKDCQ